LYPALKRAGIYDCEAKTGKHVRFHDLRRTAVSLMRDLGVIEGDISATTGHSIAVMRAVYSHPYRRNVAAALTRSPLRSRMAPNGTDEKSTTETAEEPSQLADLNGGPGRNRTTDTRIFSPKLKPTQLIEYTMISLRGLWDISASYREINP